LAEAAVQSRVNAWFEDNAQRLLLQVHGWRCCQLQSWPYPLRPVCPDCVLTCTQLQNELPNPSTFNELPEASADSEAWPRGEACRCCP
jgi:hypothetical protein